MNILKKLSVGLDIKFVRIIKGSSEATKITYEPSKEC